MKFSVLSIYRFIFILSIIMLLAIFFVVSIFYNVVIGIISFIILGFIRAIVLHSIKCPHCKKPIDNWTTIFSGNNDGLFVPMSKWCKNCGYDFTKTQE